MTKFIFFGRLEYEKGIDLILDVFPRLYAKGYTDRRLDIYGIWSYQKSCEALAALLPRNIFFHGWAQGEVRAKIFQECDFCLMPSLLIESFGLTALESLKAGVPVVGFQKWGTEPFISDALDIERQKWEDYTEKFFHLIAHLLSSHKQPSHFLPMTDLSAYTPEKRMSHFTALAGENKRILLVSDFTKRVGGIENYIHDVKELLEKNWYEAQIWGYDKKNSFRWLFKTACNISARIKLRKKIKTYKPDIIRCHSTMRELGWLPLTAIPKRNSKFKIQNSKLNSKGQGIKVWMMFHDMGYFYPYPSKLFSISELPKNFSLAARIKNIHTFSPLKITLVTLKRFSLWLMRRVLRRRSALYLVPSNFMKPIVEKTWSTKDQLTIVLPHFVK